MKYTGVKIIITTINNFTCPVTALQELFMLADNVPLFNLANKARFACNPVIKIFYQRFQS